MRTSEEYIEGIEKLFALDELRTSVQAHGIEDSHFLRLQSLIRCSIQHCEVSFHSAINSQILSSLVLLRTALEHALMARFLHQVPDGNVLSEILMDKHRSDLSDKSSDFNVTESSLRLRKMVRFQKSEYDRVPTNPTTLINKFKQREILKHLYFLLSQPSHPITALTQYVELEADGQTRRIRKKALDQDPLSALPFLFQILALTLLTDASISCDLDLENRVYEIVLGSFNESDIAPNLE
jgi:hypothetical protein